MPSETITFIPFFYMYKKRPKKRRHKFPFLDPSFMFTQVPRLGFLAYISLPSSGIDLEFRSLHVGNGETRKQAN